MKRNILRPRPSKALALVALLGYTITPGHAQTVLIDDSFSGTYNGLGGSTPDTTDVPGTQWVTSHYNRGVSATWSPDGVLADYSGNGTIAAGISFAGYGQDIDSLSVDIYKSTSRQTGSPMTFGFSTVTSLTPSGLDGPNPSTQYNTFLLQTGGLAVQVSDDGSGGLYNSGTEVASWQSPLDFTASTGDGSTVGENAFSLTYDSATGLVSVTEAGDLVASDVNVGTLSLQTAGLSSFYNTGWVDGNGGAPDGFDNFEVTTQGSALQPVTWTGVGDWVNSPADWSTSTPPLANQSAIISSGDVTVSTSNAVAGDVDNSATVDIASGGVLTTPTFENETGATLEIEAGGSLVMSGAFTQSGGSTLVLGNGVNFTPGTFVLSAATATAATITVNGSDTATIGTVIADSTGEDDELLKNGTGTLVLTQADTYSGGSEIAAGTLQASNGAALGTGSVTVDTGATLDLTGGNTYANTITISGTGSAGQGAIHATGTSSDTESLTGTITLAADATVGADNSQVTLNLGNTVNLGAFNLTTTGTGQIVINGVISGTGGLTVGGTGSTTLGGTAANTYNGDTTVSAGGMLTLQKSANVTAVAGNLNVAGEVVDLASGQLSSTTVVSLSGTGMFSFGSQGTSESIAGLTGTSANSEIMGDGSTLTLGGSGTYAYAGEILDGGTVPTDLMIVKDGSGTQEFSGANTYSGGTDIVAGALEIGNSGALGTGSVTVATGAALQLEASVGALPLSLSGTGLSNAGALENVSGSNTYSGAITLATNATIGSDAGTLTLSNASGITGTNVNLTLAGAGNGVISNGVATGSGGLTMGGTGEWTLGGTSSYTGTTAINSGTLALTGQINSSAEVTVASGATFDVSAPVITNIQALSGASGSTIVLGGRTLEFGSNSIGATFSGNIQGTTGSLIKDGTATETLTGVNTYSGGTTIMAGVLAVDNVNSQLSTGTISIGGGELLTLNTGSNTVPISLAAGVDTIAAGAGTTETYAGAINGPASPSVVFGDATNTGTIVLSGANTATGTTTVSSNTEVELTGSGSLSSGAVTDNGSIVADYATNATLANTITGSGRVMQAGAGTTVLAPSGPNGYSGGTSITAGELSLAAGTSLGTGTVTLNGGALQTSASTTVTQAVAVGASGGKILANGSTTGSYTGAITGSGNLTVDDTGSNTGTVVFAGNEGFSGTTTVAGGTLQIGAGGAAGNLAGNIVDDAAVIFNTSGTPTYASAISGTGSVTLSGTGAVTFTNSNSYSGPTTISSGSLVLGAGGNLTASAVTVQSGATLAVAPGNNGATNTAGALTLSGGTLTMLDGATSTLDATSLTTTAASALSINVGATTGSSDAIDLSGPATFTGDLTVNVDTLANAAVGTQYDFLTVGSGSISASDFTAGTEMGSLNGQTITFGVTGDTVYLVLEAGTSTSYFYTGNTSTDFTDETNYNTAEMGGMTQSNPLGATSDVYIAASSPTNLTPVLNSNLTIHSLNVTSLGSGFDLSGSGVLTVTNGVTMQSGATTGTIAVATALGAAQTWTVTDADAVLTDTGGISGGFGLTKAGSGTLVFAHANSYTGPTVINAGAISAQVTGAVDDSSSVTVASGAALQIQANVGAVPLTLSGSGLAGNGALENISGNNTYAGLITLASAATIGSDAGTLTASNVGTITGSGGALTLTGAGNGVLDSIVGASVDGLVKSGSGNWTLNGANTYTGSTMISGGTLKLNVAGAISSSSGVDLSASGATLDATSGNQTIKDLSGVAGSVVSLGASQLTLGTADSTSFAGSITGATGSIVKNGSGTLLLTGSNSYGGVTTINAGAIEVNAVSGNLGTGALTLAGGELITATTSATSLGIGISGAGTLAAVSSTAATYNGVIANGMSAGALTLGDGVNTGTIILAGANTYSGGTTIANGTVIPTSVGAFGTGDVTQNAGTLTTGGNGGATITIPGNYTMNGGTLLLNINGTGNSADLLSVGGNATLNGTLALDFTTTPSKGQIFQILTTGGVITAAGSAFTMPTVSPPGFVVETSPVIDGTSDTLSVTVDSVQLGLAQALGTGLTPNQTALLTYIDNNVISGPLFSVLSNGLNNATPASAEAFASQVADQFNPVKAANFFRSSTFNDLSFQTEAFDSYFDSQRSPNGDFAMGNGQIDSSNLTIGAVGIDPALATVSSRLVAWSPAPLAHGLLSDAPDPVLGGIELRSEDPKNVEVTPVNPPSKINTFILGNVVLGQDFSQPGSGVDHTDSTSGQVSIGVDYRITPHLRAGVLFSYNHTDSDTDDIGSKATADTYSPGVYASFADKGWYANALGMYGFSNFTEDRQIQLGGASAVAHGAPSGDQIVGNLDGGYDFHSGNWTYGPTVGVQYAHLDVNAFSEDGAGAIGADESVSKQETDSLRSRVGAHVAYSIQTLGVLLTPHLDASWQHEFMDGSEGINATIVNVTGAPFTVTTPSPSRESALIDAGLSADLNGTITVFGDYSVQAGQSNYFGQSVQAGVKAGF